MPLAASSTAIARVSPGHRAYADRLAEAFGEARLAEAVEVLERLSAVLDELGPPGDQDGSAVTEP